MITATRCCGEIEIQYRRSATGEVVHRSDCTRQGRTAYDWHYATTALGNDHGRVLAEIASIPWLRACSYCMQQAEQDGGAA